MAFHDWLRASVRLREILLALTLMLLARQPALANCSPQAASNVTATCTGATTNQGGGAPGTSTDTSGFGTGAESGITVNVAAGAANTVTGAIIGINIADGTVTNNAGASITGATYGIQTITGAVNVTNSGSITGTGTDGIRAFSATVTNNAGASITGWVDGINATTGAANVTNSGSITGTIFAATNATVTNNAGASITRGANSGTDGIDAANGAVNVTNSGSITGFYGINAFTNATVTNNAGASITGGNTGIFSTGVANVTNSGSITGTGSSGIYSATNAAVTNSAGASITAANYGIASGGAVNVTNSGSITGTSTTGIYAGTNATVTNNAGASITGGNNGIFGTGVANVTNYGNITSTGFLGIYAGTNATVTNNAGASILGAAYGIFSNGAVNVTNSGSITGTSGAGIYAATGGSSVFNAGSISSSSTAIQFSGTGNTLTLAPGSVISGNVLGTGSNTFQLGGVGAASFDVSQLGAAAQYRGFGTFNKIGSSTWTLTGTGTFAGPVSVNGGTLEVDGSIASSSGVSVNSGGMLTGAGSVAATQINAGGTLMPGSTANPTGMLTVSGNLALQSGALYLVQVTSSAAASTSVSGTATLAGTVVVDPLTRLTKATTYTILSANALSGTFNSLVLANNFATNPTLSYVGGNVELTLGPSLLSPNLPSTANTNQRTLAAAIDNALIGGSNLPGAFNALFNLGGSNLQSALTQASGETATGSQQTTFSAMGQFMGIMTDPFMGRGGGVNGSSPAIGYAAASNPTDAFAMFTKAPPASLDQPRWSVWASGFGGSQSTSGNAVVGSNDATSRIVGTAVGADYLFAPNTLAGFALAGGGTSFSVNGLGSGRSDLFQAGAYVRHTNGAAYITGALAYGWQDITTNRTVTIAGLDQLRAEFNANAYSGRVEGGYRFVAPLTGGVGVTPYAAGQFTTFDLPGYAEQAVSGANSFALAYGSRSVTDTRSELGLRADKSFAMSNGILTLRSRLAWAHDFNSDRSVAASFQALPGASFVVNGAAQAPDSALTTASAEMMLMNGWLAAATFEGEFSDVTRSYAGKGVVRYTW